MDMKWFIPFFFIIAIFIRNMEAQQNANDIYAGAREHMVESQIIRRGVHDPEVIRAMKTVPRHLFVLPGEVNEAYLDHPLPIGYNQTISQPYIVAFMTEALDLEKSDRVLEVGTGSGYQAAVLAEICDSVFTIEIIESLGEKAHHTLKSLGYTNVKVRIGDGYQGWKENGPYDAIIVTCSPTHIPEPLQDQLHEGGKMIIPVGQSYSQELILLRKRDGKLEREDVLPVRFVPMIDENGKSY